MDRKHSITSVGSWFPSHYWLVQGNQSMTEIIGYIHQLTHFFNCQYHMPLVPTNRKQMKEYNFSHHQVPFTFQVYDVGMQCFQFLSYKSRDITKSALFSDLILRQKYVMFLQFQKYSNQANWTKFFSFTSSLYRLKDQTSITLEPRYNAVYKINRKQNKVEFFFKYTYIWHSS